MGVKSIVLENHGNVAVFRRNIIHQFAVNVQLTGTDLFQTGNHTQGRGLAAAGRTDQDDKLFVGNVQIEGLNGNDAFIGDLQVDLLFRGGVFLGLFLASAVGVGVDLLDVFQLNRCHVSDSGHPASA